MGDLWDALKASGMREGTCTVCRCPMLTRGAIMMCPPCRVARQGEPAIADLLEPDHDEQTEPSEWEP